MKNNITPYKSKVSKSSQIIVKPLLKIKISRINFSVIINGFNIVSSLNPVDIPSTGKTTPDKNKNKLPVEIEARIAVSSDENKYPTTIPTKLKTNAENIKVTYPVDLTIARNLTKTSRIGFGQDSHRFITDEDKKDKKLYLGGILIENEIGLDANSDGDVILHALFNASVKALSMGFK